MNSMTQKQRGAQPAPPELTKWEIGFADRAEKLHCVLSGDVCIATVACYDMETGIKLRSRSNASLLAAAPELLDALRSILEAADRDLYGFEDGGCTAEAFSDARGLIARLGDIDAN